MVALATGLSMIEARIVKRFPPGRDSAGFHLDVQFVAKSGVTAFFGPSGSGKTLTLDSIAGFVEPDAGRILLDDRILFDAQSRVNVRARMRQCGYVFQNYALFPHMTLRENLMFGAARWSRLDRSRRVTRLLEQFRIADVAGRKPHEVSGGQKQRCSIARALVGEPRILLLDEPARGLDAPLRAELYAILHQVRSEFETPILLVTHDVDECFELADHMIVLRNGRIEQVGSPADLCSRPATLELAQLLGRFNMIPAEIRALDPSRGTSTLRIGDYEIEGEYYPGHLKGDRVHVLATPRQLRAHPLNGPLQRNEIPAELVRVIDIADRMRLEFSGGVEVEAACGAVDRNNRNWVVAFPTRGLRVL
jgi:molybdate transport system ATP-binding protein